MVLDNEAGMENLSRRIVQEVDLLVMVADPSRRGLDTLKRLHEVTGEMGIAYDKLALIINRMRRDDVPEYATQLQRETAADLLIGIPDNPELAEFGEAGRTLSENQYNFFSLTVMNISQIAQEMGIVDAGSPVGDLHMPAAFQRGKSHKQIGCTVTAIFVIMAGRSARFHWYRYSGFCHQLL